MHGRKVTLLSLLPPPPTRSLRILGTKNGRLTINNEVVKLHGWNRHTMYPDTGSALTLDQVSLACVVLRDGAAGA